MGNTLEELKLSGKNLFISGDKIGLSKDTCYLGVFPYTAREGEWNWYIGAHYMGEYVTIFDNSRPGN
jgi:hypothetical protein